MKIIRSTRTEQMGLFDPAPDRPAEPRRTERPAVPDSAHHRGTRRVDPPRDLLERERLADLDREWREAPVHSDAFCVSDHGEVLGLPRTNPRGHRLKGMRRKASVNSSGYPGLTLTKDGDPQYFHLHVLVALAFLGNPGPRGRGRGCFEVHHLDEDPLNPKADNLVWLSTADHARLAHSTLTEEAVVEMRLRAAAGETHQALADEFGVARVTATHAITGRSWADIELPD